MLCDCHNKHNAFFKLHLMPCDMIMSSDTTTKFPFFGLFCCWVFFIVFFIIIIFQRVIGYQGKGKTVILALDIGSILGFSTVTVPF